MDSVLFLDIDGVLNSKAHLIGRAMAFDNSWAGSIDRRLVTHVNRVVEATGALVVICSDWRHLLTLPTLRKTLQRRGFVGRIIDTTNALRNADRGLECAAWLASTRRSVDAFAAIDDRRDFAPIERQHVRPNKLHGISNQDADQAIRILSRPAKATIASYRARVDKLRALTVPVRTSTNVPTRNAERVLEEVYARLYPKLVTVPC